MKKINPLKFVTNRLFWSYVLALGLGAAVGILIYAHFFVDKVDKTKASTPTAINKAIQKNTLSNKSNLDKAYKTAQQRVDTGVERKEITQDQANKLQAKLTEIYNYRKNLDASKKEPLADLNNKRKEWRAWLDENKLSLKYIITLYWN